MNFLAAARNIHADPRWWQKVLLGGALTMTVFGATWPAGLVVESMDNVRKGFATPLPPSVDAGTRMLIGLFALLLDFFFFVIPVLVAVLLFACVGIGASLGQANTSGVQPLGVGFVITLAAIVIILFVLGIAPISRLRYIEQGSIEQALQAGPVVRQALEPRRRALYRAARLHSLPGYAPLVLLAAAAWGSTQVQIPAGGLLSAVLFWLACSALVYAHLVVAQLYGDAERHLR
ncbi:MAG: DUF4013 domain-containing protein [Roseiflexaceae bacterium]|nr:DUF4013 domain-containing protein [Roseiflexaceae bacterium]